MRSYVIHLEESVDRKPIVDALFEALPNPQVLSAVDGRKMTKQDQQEYISTQCFPPKYPFDMLPGELGCFLSHRKLWADLVSSKAEAALVAEDDIVLDRTAFDVAREIAMEHASSNRLIRFPIKDREVPGAVIASKDEATLFRPAVIGLTTGLYLIGREAARHALAASERIDRPVDAFLQMRWQTGIDTLTVWPSGATSAASGAEKSTVQSKRGLFQEISRVARRSQYRARIRRLSKASMS